MRPVHRVSVVVPVFNSAGSLDELCDRIRAALEAVSGLDAWEVVLVNDGSEDASWEMITRLSAEHPAVHGLDLTRNWGQHNALLAGIHAASCEVIVTMDDDLQHRPEDVPRLLEALTCGFDLVYGRQERKRHGAHRRVATRIDRGLMYALSGGRIPVDIGGFRAFRVSLLDGVGAAQGAHFAIDTPLTESATGIAMVAVVHDERTRGETNYNLGRLVFHALIELGSLPWLRGRGRSGPTYAIRRTTDETAVRAQAA